MFIHVEKKKKRTIDRLQQSKELQPHEEMSKLESGGGAICWHLGVNCCPAFQTEMYIQVA